MKQLMLVLLCVLAVTVSANATVYTGAPGVVNTLTESGGVYSFSETYDWTDEAVLGEWASRTNYYKGDQYAGMGTNRITLKPGNSESIIYSFIVPVTATSIEFSVDLRCGSALRAAAYTGVPGESSMNNYFWAESLLAVGEKLSTWGFVNYTGTIPASVLNNTVPGQTSFSLLVYNATGEWEAAGIDTLEITAVPEPVSLVMMAMGVFGILRRRS